MDLFESVSFSRRSVLGLETAAMGAPEKPIDPVHPSPEAIALHRLAFGPRPHDVEKVQAMGLTNWIKAQLKPNDADDPEFWPRLKELTLEIHYDYKNEAKEKVFVKEQRPLELLNKSEKELWSLTDNKVSKHYEERLRPLREVQMMTLLRAVYSKWQLREVAVDFWHNHFNVNGYVDDEKCRILFPVYDRDVIRKNALGNFREMLGAVARSTSMLVYLNNYRSKASPANENYARELFELHTLGAENYLNHLYKRWKEVPGATEGKPTGYIDQDVYEAARAFTGWTVADGFYTGRDNEHLPHNGGFYYHDGWHDNYQKRILGVEFEPNQPPMADGEKVLDLVANHPGTARYICSKLVKRLVADDPPKAIVDAAVKTWTENKKSEHQIARVIETIATHPDFSKTWGKKVKRPLEVMTAFLRATEPEFKPNMLAIYWLDQMGQKMFTYPLPTGHPDTSEHWLSTFGWLLRWNSPWLLAWEGSHLTKYPGKAPLPSKPESIPQVIQYQAERMLGYRPSNATLNGLIDFVNRNGEVHVSNWDDVNLHKGLRALQLIIATTPEFHAR